MADPTLKIGAAGEADALPPLPAVDFLTGRGFITGKSGSGKSNTASVLIEEMLSEGLAAFIVDTDGEYYGLKQEFEVLHVGADETCDLQVGPEHAPRIAELALHQNVPVILDLSAYLSGEEARALVASACGALFRKQREARRPLPVFVEEVHEFLPEGGGLDEVGKVLIRLAKRGRKRGLGFCGISQRPASVKKDFITQCDYLFWHRLTWDNDTRVVGRVAGTEAARVVPDLADGEALFEADFLRPGTREDAEGPLRVQMRRKHTFDAGATPSLGEAGRRPALKELSGEVARELKEISKREREKKSELERTRTENERLRKEVGRLEEEVERQKDVTRLAERFTSAMEQSSSGAGVQGTAESLRGEAREALAEARREKRTAEEERSQLAERLKKAQARADELEAQAETAQRLEHLEQHLPEMQEAVRRLAEGLGIQDQAGGGAPPEKVRERAQRLAGRVEELEGKLKKARRAGSGVNSSEGDQSEPIAPSVEQFMRSDCVQRGIRRAKEEAPARYVDGVLHALLQGRERVTYERVATRVGIKTTSHISTAARALEKQGVVVLFGRPREIELNLSGLAELRAARERSERADALMAEL